MLKRAIRFETILVAVTAVATIALVTMTRHALRRARA